MEEKRGRAFRRHKSHSKMMRRLKEDRNEHYMDLSCPCWYDKKAMARFKEQPKLCSCSMCCNVRRNEWTKENGKLTLQELRFLCKKIDAGK